MNYASELPRVDDPDAVVDGPTVFRPYPVGPAVDVIPAYLPAPGMGVLPANSYLVRGEQPMLVDAGPGGSAGAFATALRSCIDPSELQWLWLTHTDADHIGALAWLLDEAPRLRVVTTYLAVGKLGLHAPVPLERVYWCNPGEQLDIGDRTLVALRPPSFDAPETTAVYDPTTSTLFSADAFGALLAAPAVTADDVSSGDLEEGLVLWARVDSPWLALVDERAFAASLAEIERLAPARVLSAHLPPATGMHTSLTRWLQRVPAAGLWSGPDQAALEALLAQVPAPAATGVQLA